MILMSLNRADKFIFVGGAIVLGFLRLIACFPNEEAKSEKTFKIRADVDLVTVEVTALDRKGFAIQNTNNFDGELNKLERQISNYYTLGFHSDNPKHDGTFRKLKIKTGLKGVALKHKNGYWVRRPDDVSGRSR